MNETRVLIISPALALANNGNWQTASRWSRLMRPDCHTQILSHWQGEDAEVMLALHARKSAPSALAWAQATGPDRLAVVLTGTDLYRDIHTDPLAQQVLGAAGQLVVLQERGPDALPESIRHRAHVIFQSTPRRVTLTKTTQHLRALMVGHLRDEKDPLTYVRAAARLAGRADMALDHIGGALDAALEQAVVDAARHQANYRWLGSLAHDRTRQRIQRAHVLVHASTLEGGAHVILEAVQSGTPVLASRIDGNVGMLGGAYAGYFEAGDDAGLAELLLRCREQPGFLDLLRHQCDARSTLFEPQREQVLLRGLISGLVATPD